ncbi:MAG: hypothetical protein M3478_06105 [Planctomycetota bacterium]|nr:hypothetical protein [Planctomycetota bacterium]
MPWLRATSVLLILAGAARAERGEWPEPRQNAHLTSVQPLPGAMTAPPQLIAEYDLGRTRPQLTIATRNKQPVGLTIVAGELRCYDTTGTQLWASHPPGLNFTTIVAAEDLDGDGGAEVLLQAGRPAQPFGAAVLVSLDDGKLRWRYDVDPHSYVWSLHCGSYLPGTASKQLAVIMQGYPPDEKNGYIAMF